MSDNARHRITGTRVQRLARECTPGQVAELLAIRLTMFHPKTRTPTNRVNARDPDIEPLIRRRLITWKPAPGWSKRRWRMATLTELGERVLLDIAEEAMVQAGVCKSIVEEEDHHV